MAIALTTDDIGAPSLIKPQPWSPHSIVVFGDSLSDSHGDDFRDKSNALSTYNLLKTLRGDVKEAGSEEPPINLSDFFSRGSNIRNIRAHFELYQQELKAERREKGFIGKILNRIQSAFIDRLEEVIISLLQKLDDTDKVQDEAWIATFINCSKVITKIKNIANDFSLDTVAMIMSRLEDKLSTLFALVKDDLDVNVADFAESALINVTSQFSDVIPLVPDDQYYETGKWIAKNDIGLVWPEILVKMMSFPNKSRVKLDNRAMAGSWILCAEGKLGRPDSLLKTIEGLSNAATILFQGSLVPPCEGLIVQSYLDERRVKIPQGESTKNLFDPNTLTIFFNGGNDFLNNWNNPDDIAQEHSHDIWSVLNAGAKRVIVIILPDISTTPRFKNSPERLTISNNWLNYNKSLRSRLELLREEFSEDSPYRLMTVDAQEIFQKLQQEPGWDHDNPILDVPISGVDDSDDTAETQRSELIKKKKDEAQEQNNVINAELYNNVALEDTWLTKGLRATPETDTKKIRFYSDSVHPSYEAHLAIARLLCDKMSADFNIPCSPANYLSTLDTPNDAEVSFTARILQDEIKNSPDSLKDEL